jgi:hypothetical protein
MSTAGEPLPGPTQEKMEQAFGADFSAVRIHQGGQAEAVGALAYAEGNDLHFAPGEYRPGTQAGDALIGHELTQVMQQWGGQVSGGQGKNANVVEDASLEQEADHLGERAARGESVAAEVSGHVPQAPSEDHLSVGGHR